MHTRLLVGQVEHGVRQPALEALVENKRELLHGGDDDFLPALNELAQVSGTLSVADRCPDLGELLDGVADLPVKNAPVGNHDHRIEYGFTVFGEADQLVGEPSDGVRLAAAR